MSRRDIAIAAAVVAAVSCSNCGKKPVPPPRVVETIGARAPLVPATPPAEEELVRLAAALEPLHERMGPSQPGDWLLHHDEPGQSFEQYKASDPVVPGETLTTIYVLPLGAFSEAEERIVTLTARLMALWFGVEVKVQETVSLDVIPESARRVHPSWGDSQILTGHVLYELLEPNLPGDALGYLALTTSDLWPGKGWNFVFGQASLRKRVGVWSIYRKGDADDEEEFGRVLWLTATTATHEMGHMIGILHCTDWECGMNGSNNLAESMRHPAYLCPECIKKLWWATGVDPSQRFRDLADFCEEHGLEEEAYYRSALEIVSATASPSHTPSP